MSIRYIVYVSRLADPEGPGAVANIIRKARANNTARGITGALIYDGERFCQYLEGEPDAIERTFAAIERDPRHDGICVLASGEAVASRYGKWSMAYAYAATAELIDSIGKPHVAAVPDAFQAVLARCDTDA